MYVCALEKWEQRKCLSFMYVCAFMCFTDKFWDHRTCALQYHLPRGGQSDKLSTSPSNGEPSDSQSGPGSLKKKKLVLFAGASLLRTDSLVGTSISPFSISQSRHRKGLALIQRQPSNIKGPCAKSFLPIPSASAGRPPPVALVVCS